jgi:tRNA 2-(methylsulfanyl)-N6-isopentenyladenosine37 hydroxylase
MSFELHYHTPATWAEYIVEHMDAFLLDHAACEKKASSMAMSLVAHYPDKPDLVSAMTQLAVEELIHFKEVVKIILERQLQLTPDQKDHYVGQFRKCIRGGTEPYFIDRMLVASIIEARGHERFGLIADALTDTKLKSFYAAITASEQRHQDLFLSLIKAHAEPQIIDLRLQELLHAEAAIIAACPLRPALH